MGLSTMHLHSGHCRSTRATPPGRKRLRESGWDARMLGGALVWISPIIHFTLILFGLPRFFLSLAGRPPWACRRKCLHCGQFSSVCGTQSCTTIALSTTFPSLYCLVFVRQDIQSRVGCVSGVSFLMSMPNPLASHSSFFEQGEEFLISTYRIYDYF